MINESLYQPIEKKIISKTNRFNVSRADNNEIKKDFKNSIILIVGGAGSIGSQFSKDILKFNYKKLYIIDKDENQLTELNREILLKVNKNQLKKINYICSDLVTLNLDSFLKEKKITHYINFAAIKHVRSEEELISTKYMFMTNSKYFLTKYKHYLKKLFSISTDKTVNPSSLLGISKYIMESNLKTFKKKNNIFVSSVRFANVSFSNGSILKYVVDRTIRKQPFGVPRTIKRFFITHQEASSLCLKALLNKNDGKIVVPNEIKLKQDYLISDLVVKIMKYFSYSVKFVSFSNLNNVLSDKVYKVFLTNPNNDGQKFYEEFYYKSEKLINDEGDSSIKKVNLPNIKNANKVLDKINKFNNIKKLQSYIKIKFSKYKPISKSLKVSKII